jgi:hypothetical protein
MENQNVKLNAHGAEIQVNPNACVYVTINGMTVYFENSSTGLEPYVSFWNESSGIDEATNLSDLTDKIMDLENQNSDLKTKIQDLEKMQKTSIYWSHEDIMFLLEENPEKYKGIKLTKKQMQFVVELAIEEHDADFGLNWFALRSYLDNYIIEYIKKERL